MKFEEVIESWNKDHVVDIYDISNEIARIPGLHQKYLDILLHYKALVKKIEQEHAVVKRDLTDYYMGRAERPSPVRIIKTESPTYLAADQRMQDVESKLEHAKLAVFYLEKILKMIEGRSWDLRTAMEWQKFTAGGR